jgi:hypothetical protein
MSQITEPAPERVAPKIPTTVEINEAMEVTKKHLKETKREPDITTTGKKIIDDTSRVISSAQRVLAEKNKGEKLQKLYMETKLARDDLAPHAGRMKNMQEETLDKLDSDRLKSMGREVLTTARLAGMQLVTSNSFRKSVLDFIQVANDIFAHPGETTTGEGLEEDTERLSLKDKGKGPATTAVTGPTTSTASAGSPKAHFLSDTSSTTTGGGLSESGVGSSTGTASPTLTTTGGVVSGRGGTEETKLTKLSDEQIERLYDRLMIVLREATRREKSRRVFTGLLDLFNFVSGRVTETPAKQTMQATTWDITHNEHVYNVLRLAKEIFEEFTGNRTLDPFLRRVRHIVRIFRRDPEGRQVFLDIRSFLRDVLKEPTLLDDPAFHDRGRALLRRATSLHNRKLNKHLTGAFYEAKELVNSAANDPALNALRRDMKRLMKDIILDREGNVTIKPEALDQLRRIIVSTLIQKMTIPLPEMTVHEEAIDYTISNAVICLEDIVPENVYVKSKAKLGVDLGNVREPSTDVASNIIKFKIKGINVHLPDANIWFRRKKFPRVEDEGRARIDIGGRGIDLVIKIETFLRSVEFFRVAKVKCDVHNFRLHLADTRHDFLYNTFVKIFSRRIKKNMRTSVERRIRTNLEQINYMLKKQIDKSKLPSQFLSSTSASLKS